MDNVSVTICINSAQGDIDPKVDEFFGVMFKDVPGINNADGFLTMG